MSSKGSSGVTVKPPVEPMLAKLAEELPPGTGYLYEPKWDGFRAIVFRGRNDVYIQSRDSRPLDRYFPELHDALLERLPKDCVVDGEIVIATAQGLDFDALQLRLHPAESRVVKLAKDTPSSFVAFDVLAVSGRNLLGSPQSERRAVLEKLLRAVKPPVYLTPVTRDRAVALEWLTRFEGAGLDGVIAKPESGAYLPGKRARPTVWSRDSAGTRAGRTRSVRCCSACTTTQECSSTSGLLPPSPWPGAGSSQGSSRRSARTRWMTTRGENGREPQPNRAGCLVHKAAGARAKTCPGNRSGLSASAR